MKYKPRAVKSLPERFWAKVRKSDGCWIWTGAQVPSGYGRMGLGRRGSGWDYAHRVSYRLHYEEPGDGIVAHRCDNPQCVRPSHLFLTTHAGNVADKMAKGRARGRYSDPSTLIHRHAA